MEKFKAVLQLQSQYRSALSYGLITLLTAGGEKIFSTVVFECPCNATWNLPYGLVFLLVPALALFLLGYALSARTWRLLTGCCFQSTSESSSPRLHRAFVCMQISGMAAVASLTWVAVALLGGSFYVCAASGSTLMATRLCKNRDPGCVDKLPQVPCKQEAEMLDMQSELKAQSQVFGWVLIAAVIILVLLVKSIIRCISPISYLQLQFWKIYVEKEKQILQSQATEHATQLAKETVRCFFECANPNECKTPSREAWEQISALYTFNRENQFYSILHKYVNKKKEKDNVSSSKGEEMVPILHFVDDAGMTNTHQL
ncbi:FAM26F [Sigmodon hispidus]